MPSYNFKGYFKSGKEVKGSREASSKQTLTAELLAEGIYATNISDVQLKKQKFEDILNLFAHKKNLADTFFQLSLLLRSGIPLVEALKIIAKTTKQTKLKQALLESAARVSEGMRFSDSLARYPAIFEPMYVNLIRASEQIGRLSEVLADIAIYEEDKRKNADKLSSAMIYPMTILVLGLGVLGFMLSFVVPKMQSIFTSMKQEIPASTKFLLAVSRFMQSYGLYFLVLVIFIIFAIRYAYKHNTKFRMKIDKRLYKINIISSISVAKFSHILSFQLREGLPLTDALHFAGMTIDNLYLKQTVAEIRTAVQAGTKFSTAVRKSDAFPDLFPAAVSTGESSGNMPDLLERVNEFYSKQVDKFLSFFVSIIEPLFIVFIGVLVGFIVVSIMEPLFQMNTMTK